MDIKSIYSYFQTGKRTEPGFNGAVIVDWEGGGGEGRIRIGEVMQCSVECGTILHAGSKFLDCRELDH